MTIEAVQSALPKCDASQVIALLDSIIFVSSSAHAGTE